MAEVAGLAIGIIGLGGLIGAFKDTIDLFTLVVDTRHLGRQYEILDTKLDIEKTLLLQRADRVRLLRNDYDKRLDDANTQRLLTRILASIGSILSDSEGLQERYGLRSEDDASLAADPIAPASSHLVASGLPLEALTRELPSPPTDKARRNRWRISQPRMDKFVRDFNALQLRAGSREKAASVLCKARWVIRDKQKFEHLIQDLAHFISKLSEVIPATSYDPASASDNAMITSDLALIKTNLGHLKIILEASEGQHRAIAESTQHAIDKTHQDHVLDTLWFRRINDRKDSIAEAHRKTFQWALEEPPKGTDAWDSLPAWLRHGSGIYWISGKAGSGKSTLMKYIYSHGLTDTMFSQWANGGRYVRCHFFVSNLGSDEQKTQDGLSRTLLHQILSQRPSLIQHALPNMWKESLESQRTESIGLPSATETRRALEVIAGHASIVGRCCLFIDGLDEFVGDYADAVDFVKQLAKSEDIKVVVSSRPVPACVDAFRFLPRLQLHHLTQTDIQMYVNEVVGGHPSMQSHMRRFPQDSQKLLSELVQKSCGVFLWVILACRSVLGGFADSDRLSEIRRRVDELPPELEDMFRHMLGKVQKRHQRQGAQLFKICHTYQKTNSPFLRTDLFALGLALVDDYHTGPISIKAVTAEDDREICEELEGRLRSRCGGLLEMKTARTPPAGKEIGPKVSFMHRTVFEFLNNADVWKLDCLRTQDAAFDAATALSLYGIHMAVQALSETNDVQAMDHLEVGLWWGVVADRERPGDTRNCFFHLGPFLDALSQPGRQLWTATMQRLKQLYATIIPAAPPGHPSARFMLAVEAGALNFVRQHPDFAAAKARNRRCPCQTCRPILIHAVSKRCLSHKFNDEPSDGIFSRTEMTRLLLKSGFEGADLLEDICVLWMDNLWLWVDESGQPEGSKLSGRERLLLQSTARAFLEAGVDPKLIHPFLKSVDPSYVGTEMEI
ncbi:prion-inhibition and propagation-domain-containing protein [Chaetomium fimeti]|uniref:Prion-inhibition and propagation-domain-containing protein n=1 Tax=Chaetomium fimeti TaxID=1854472 RepID=A0AAE0LN53_9PEZI|nr:prion-inhibition and propagation-domain-containing protein [Chaetomium fimeti]